MNRLQPIYNHFNSLYIKSYPTTCSILSKISRIAPFAGAAYYFNRCRNEGVLSEKEIKHLEPKKIFISATDKNINIHYPEEKQPKTTFLPKPQEISKENATPGTIEKVRQNLESTIIQSLKLAFQAKFEDAQKILEDKQPISSQDAPETKEMLRVLRKEINFIGYLKKIHAWHPFSDARDLKIKEFKAEAKKLWVLAMQVDAEKRNKNLKDFFSLIEIGLTRGWFEKGKMWDLFKILPREVDNHLEKVWMSDLIARANNEIKPDKMAIRVTMSQLQPNEGATLAELKQRLAHLSDLLVYFCNLNREVSLSETCETIFKLLKQIPIETELYSTTFRQILKCLPFHNEAKVWALTRMADAVKKSPGDPQKKIELLLVIQNDLQKIGKNQEAKDTLNLVKSMADAVEKSPGDPQKKIELLLVIQNDLQKIGEKQKAKDTLKNAKSMIDSVPLSAQRDLILQLAEGYRELDLLDTANQLIDHYNEPIRNKEYQLNLIQGISFAILGVSTFFVHPLYPLLGYVAVPFIPKLMDRN